MGFSLFPFPDTSCKFSSQKRNHTVPVSYLGGGALSLNGLTGPVPVPVNTAEKIKWNEGPYSVEVLWFEVFRKLLHLPLHSLNQMSLLRLELSHMKSPADHIFLLQHDCQISPLDQIIKIFITLAIMYNK